MSTSTVINYLKHNCAGRTVRVVRNLVILTLLFCNSVVSAEKSDGIIKGSIVNEHTKEPLIGVNIVILNSQSGAATDNEGKYAIYKVPAGSYSIEFRSIGFEKIIRSDVIVRPDRITYLNVELSETIIEGNEIVVNTGYFWEEEKEPVSLVNFNAEEIRRSPGSVGDISRVLHAMPSTAVVADNKNDLLVRGGSPIENAFFVDNIQIPNINHFPTQGTSGGPIGILNVDFIDNVNFSAGGFSAAYGDRLSSVVDIKLREGNRERIDTQLDADMSGFGGILEGPIKNGKGSWFISSRHSFLDLIVDAIGTGVAPRYGDVQGKLTYDINPSNRITFLNIFGNSRINTRRENSLKDGSPNFGDYKANQNTLGSNWRHIWKNNGYSNTTLSYSFTKSDDIWYSTVSGKKSRSSGYLEGMIRFRNVNYFEFDRKNKLEFGLDGEYNKDNYDYFFAPYIDRQGNLSSGLTVNDVFHASKGGAFGNYIWTPVNPLTMTIGIRGDYFSLTKRSYFSPRFSARMKVTDRFSLNGAAGIYSQSLPMFLYSQEPKNKNLKNPRAIHYITGFDYMLTSNTKLSLEIYDKEYSNFPLEPGDPALFVVDDGIFSFGNYNNLVDKGKASSRGIELLVQKKLAQNFYGLLSASYFRSRYQDYNGIWRNRNYDNKFLFNIIGGYKPNNVWEFSMKFTYAGGVPYTPFDIERSQELNSGIIDREKINAMRYPDYHSLNVRFDRRFNFKNSDIVFYMSVWNAYNRKNVALYYWNEVNNKQNAMYQWSFIPVFGMEYEF